MEQDVVEQLLDWVRSHYFGKYRAVVTDNADPDMRGRLKVRVPSVLDDNEVWAMPCVPYAGAGVGFYSLPEPDTGVWVEFEAGDPSFPVWTGCFWGAGELPDQSDPNIKTWKTLKFTLRIDDSADELRAEASSGSKVTISRDVTTESGGAKHTVGSSGVVSEKSAGKVEVTDASVRVNSGALEVM
ncbi:MAG: phage baseplate assembly protein V [Chloroflexota bacterium]